MPLKHSVEEIVLDNGAKGLIIDVPGSTVVSYGVNFRAGFEQSDKSIYETAHLLEHMVCKGVSSKFLTSALFSQELTKNGAWGNAVTNTHCITYTAASAAMEWDRILDLLEIEITKPDFKKEIFETEKGNVKEELARNGNNYDRVVWQQVRKSMGTLQLTDSDRVAIIDNIRFEDIENHYQKTHTLGNMRFILAGDLSEYKQEIISKLNGWSLPSGERLSAITLEPKSSPAVCINRDISSLVFCFNITIGRELSRKEMNTAMVIRHTLAVTYHSRIHGKARAMGLCYHINCSLDYDISGKSDWWISATVKPDNAESLFQLIKTEMKNLVESGVTIDELNAIKQYAVGNYQMKCQTVGELNSWYSSEYFDHESIDYLDKYADLIESTTPQEVIELAQEFINKGKWTLGIVGNVSESDVEPYYKILSQIFEDR